MTAASSAPQSSSSQVVQAEEKDSFVLSRVIAHAFFDLAVSQWLLPNPEVRRRIFPPYFQIYVEHAFTRGLVLTTPDRDAVALWLPVGRAGPDAPEDYHARLVVVTGPHRDRFLTLDEAFDRHHPVGVKHEHLAIVAVRPGRQRRGIGTALLDARHELLDRLGIPAYLEASDPAKRDIYRKHGYVLRPNAPIRLPDGGPELFPMWREPRSGHVA